MATILVIDDDPTALKLLRMRFQHAGYQVSEAKDGKEGLEKAERERPDLIILDVRLPKVDGWQVCRELKSNPRTSACPVILLTGCSQDIQELYGLQCGADEYLTKPWDAVQLLEIANKLIKQSAWSRDLRSAAAQQRVKQLVQRVVRMVGGLPKGPNVEPLSGQVLQHAASMAAAYQEALKNGPDRLKAQWAEVAHSSRELVYWLGLLNDSKTSTDPNIPLLLAEAQIILESFSTADRRSSSP